MFLKLVYFLFFGDFFAYNWQIMDEIIKNKNIFIQYDPNAFKNFSSKLFNIDYITKEGLIKSEISGRGKTY